MKKLNLSFTSFLKLSSLSERAKLTQLRRRLDDDGYDFHRTLKRVVSKYIQGDVSFDQGVEEISRVNAEPERRLTLQAFKSFVNWADEQSVNWAPNPIGAYEAESGVMSVRLEPEISFRRPAARATEVLCLWNLVAPDLKNDIAAKGLSLLRRTLAGGNSRSYKIFNLKNQRIFDESVTTWVTPARLERDIIVIDTLWQDIQDEQMTNDAILSHVSSLSFPPPSPPPT